MVISGHARVRPQTSSASSSSRSRCQAHQIETLKNAPQSGFISQSRDRKVTRGIIQPIDYFKWISNMVPIIRPSGDIRICTDFKDLNKACPKDDFPLPNINMIVDLTAGHELLSLMDGFSRYNQIHIAKED